MAGVWQLILISMAAAPAAAWLAVSAGGFHTCGIRTNGTLTCWGSNGFGRAPALTLSPTVNLPLVINP